MLSTMIRKGGPPVVTKRRRTDDSAPRSRRHIVSIGARIRTAREAADLSQSDLARRIGISSQSVNQWEGGFKEPSRRNVMAVASVCMVATDWLLFGPHALTRRDRPISILPSQVTGRAVPMYSTISDAVARGARPSSTVPAMFACGARAFAFPLPDDRCAGSDDRKGDVWIVDPDAKPKHGDMVLAILDEDVPVYGQLELRRTGKGRRGKRLITIVPTDKRWRPVKQEDGKLQIVAVLAGRIQPAR